jgi:hypothetical protein
MLQVGGFRGLVVSFREANFVADRGMARHQKEYVFIFIKVVETIVVEFSFCKVGVFSVANFDVMNRLSDLNCKISLLI